MYAIVVDMNSVPSGETLKRGEEWSKPEEWVRVRLATASGRDVSSDPFLIERGHQYRITVGGGRQGTERPPEPTD